MFYESLVATCPEALRFGLVDVGIECFMPPGATCSEASRFRLISVGIEYFMPPGGIVS